MLEQNPESIIVPPALLQQPLSCEKRIIRALRQMTQYLDTHSRQLLKSNNITVPQVMCLEALIDKGMMTVSSLARDIRLSASTTVGIIDRLEKKKLVKRIPDKVDRRSVFVEITQQGRDFFAVTPHLLHNRLQQAMRHLSKDECVAIADTLDGLVSMLGRDKAM